MRAKLVIMIDLEDTSEEEKVVNWIADPEALGNTIREDLEHCDDVTVHSISIREGELVMKIKVTATESNLVTVGQEYEITDNIGDILFTIDDYGDEFSFLANECVKFEIISGSIGKL